MNEYALDEIDAIHYHYTILGSSESEVFVKINSRDWNGIQKSEVFIYNKNFQQNKIEFSKKTRRF